jgi:hypothetical protein
MAKAQAFGDKVHGKIRTNKRMVKYILPAKGEGRSKVRFKEGMIIVPDDQEHGAFMNTQMAELLK